MVKPGVIGQTGSVMTSWAPNAARALRLAMSVKQHRRLPVADDLAQVAARCGDLGDAQRVEPVRLAAVTGALGMTTPSGPTVMISSGPTSVVMISSSGRLPSRTW